MASADVLEKVDLLGPKPQKAYLDAKIEESESLKHFPSIRSS